MPGCDRSERAVIDATTVRRLLFTAVVREVRYVLGGRTVTRST